MGELRKRLIRGVPQSQADWFRDHFDRCALVAPVTNQQMRMLHDASHMRAAIVQVRDAIKSTRDRPDIPIEKRRAAFRKLTELEGLYREGMRELREVTKAQICARDRQPSGDQR
jgi:hypothetical protein